MLTGMKLQVYDGFGPFGPLLQPTPYHVPRSLGLKISLSNVFYSLITKIRN